MAPDKGRVVGVRKRGRCLVAPIKGRVVGVRKRGTLSCGSY